MQKKSTTPKIFSSKKGEAPGPTGTQAATLVVLITILIIFYLLFIPPDVRDEILEGTGENISDDSSSSNGNKTLLLETPGTLEEMEERDIEHLINAVYLFATEESKILEKVPALSVKNSWFTEKEAEFTFDIDDVENVENVLLSFVAEDRKGILTIMLNDAEVYSGEIDSVNFEPMTLKEKYLEEGENVLKLSVSDVGWAFWKVNKYQLKSIQINADVTDISDQLSKNIFIVSTTEKNNVERSVMRFTPDCLPGQVGTLNVFVNGHSIYSSVPDCGAPTAIEFLPDVLRVGENQLMFRTDDGNYLVDLIKITSEMKQSFQPVYYFDVDEDEFADIKDEDIDVMLELTFTDNKELKQGTININGVETSIYQTERVYDKKINDWIVEGSNSIKILPEDRLEITQLEVVKE